jgi:hypothetical protein
MEAGSWGRPRSKGQAAPSHPAEKYSLMDYIKPNPTRLRQAYGAARSFRTGTIKPNQSKSDLIRPLKLKQPCRAKNRPAYATASARQEGAMEIWVVKLRNKANFSAKNPMKGHQCPKKQTQFKAKQSQYKPKLEAF